MHHHADDCYHQGPTAFHNRFCKKMKRRQDMTTSSNSFKSREDKKVLSGKLTLKYDKAEVKKIKYRR